MKKFIIPVVVVVVLLVFFLVFFIINNPGSNVKYEKEISKGEVTIGLTPKDFKDSQLYFDISFDTHSVELSGYDLKELTTLNYGSQILKPVIAPTLSGHHVSGVLVFEVDREPSAFSVVITGIPDVDVRRFEWKLE